MILDSGLLYEIELSLQGRICYRYAVIFEQVTDWPALEHRQSN